MAHPDAKLTALQQRLVLALITEPTKTKAAEKAGVPQRTMYNWLENDVFQAAYQRARRELYAESIGCIARGLQLASETAIEIMLAARKDRDRENALRAAKQVFEMSRWGFELDNQVAHDRIQRLYVELASKKDPPAEETPVYFAPRYFALHYSIGLGGMALS